MNISEHILCSTVPDSCDGLLDDNLLVDNLLVDRLTEWQLRQLTETDCVRQQVPLMDAIDLRLYVEMSNVPGGAL